MTVLLLQQTQSMSVHTCTYTFFHFIHAGPDQVRGVRFVSSANKNTLFVEWSRPQSDAPILHYEIRSRQRDQPWQGPVTATTEMVNLRRNVVPLASYGVQVRAVSVIGAGPYSREEILEGFLQH